MYHVLICDDEPHIVEGLRYLLRTPDRLIWVARNGEEALRLVEQQIPDLLITDIMMPLMDGLELIATLRQQPTTQNLPVIVLTAKGQAQGGAMAQELYQATVVAKPFEPARLRTMVQATLESLRCAAPNSIW